MKKMMAVVSRNRIGKLLLIAGLLLVGFTTVSNPFDKVVSALGDGDVETLSLYFDKMIDISLDGKSSSYSKSQAVVILKDFFSTHKAKEFKIIHKGKSSKGSSFGIGNLTTGDGDFRVTFFFRQKGNDVVLQELRLKKDNGN